MHWEEFLNAFETTTKIYCQWFTLLLQTTSYNEDEEFQNILAKRSAKKQRSDFDRYIEIPNDSGIQSSLGWWKQNQSASPDLAKMARDVLAVPASGCAVEREFSISGRIATFAM